MFIQTEATPNPATLKFLPGNTVLGSGTADFRSKDTSEKSPLASKIFQVEGVAAVFLGTDFITVTKNEEIDWDHIKSSILGSIFVALEDNDSKSVFKFLDEVPIF